MALALHNATNWVIAIGDDGAVSSPVGIEAGGVATIVLGDPPANIDAGEVLAEVRMSRRLEAIEDLEAALESSTATYATAWLHLPDEVEVRARPFVGVPVARH